MQSNNILSAPLIDIIFDGRNKDYGAYELRKKYDKRMRKALFITGLIATLTFGSVVLANSFKKDASNYRLGPEITLQDIPDKKEPEKLPEPEKPKPVEPEVKTERFTEIKMVEEPESPPPSTQELTEAKIDVDPKEGKIDEGEGGPPKDIDKGTGIVEPKAKEPEGPAERVDIDARFDGNWKRFLETNLDGNVPVNNSAPAGRYSVVIRFVVDVDGTVSNIEPLTKHGYGLEEEGIRVIKKSKKWEPAFLNGVHIKAYRKQVIIFDVMEE